MSTESSLLLFIDHLCPAVPVAITEPPLPIEEPTEEPSPNQDDIPTKPMPVVVPVTRAQLPPVTWVPTDHRRQRGLREAFIALGIQAICIVFFVFHDHRED